MAKPSLRSYAQSSVSPSRSKEQIEELLLKVDARGFRWSNQLGTPGYEVLEALLRWNERNIGFRLRIEYGDDRERKQKLRALYWYLKTKVEAIQMGLVDLEREFLPYLLTASGQTVYDELGGDEMRLLSAPSAENDRPSGETDVKAKRSHDD